LKEVSKLNDVLLDRNQEHERNLGQEWFVLTLLPLLVDLCLNYILDYNLIIFAAFMEQLPTLDVIPGNLDSVAKALLTGRKSWQGKKVPRRPHRLKLKFSLEQLVT
jgi:hypothetical protein